MIKHTPYDGSSKPFGIGLRPLDLDNWIEVDERLPHYLGEKTRLILEKSGKVFVSTDESLDAQSEVLELLTSYLPDRFPKIYSRNGSYMSIAGMNDPVDLQDTSNPPLFIAANLVQEDLVLMRKSPEGWRLVAASVCFPSSWVLQEKFNKPLADIHAPVPGFNRGTKNASRIERIFDNLQVKQPVERFNWSVYNDDALYHADRSGEHFVDGPGQNLKYFLRVEHQTLRKLPATGDILFTIRIHIDPIELLSKRKDRAHLARTFMNEIKAMSADERQYKGFDSGQQALLQKLAEIAA